MEPGSKANNQTFVAQTRSANDQKKNPTSLTVIFNGLVNDFILLSLEYDKMLTLT